jgi:hypothetical protein
MIGNPKLTILSQRRNAALSAAKDLRRYGRRKEAELAMITYRKLQLEIKDLMKHPRVSRQKVF